MTARRWTRQAGRAAALAGLVAAAAAILAAPSPPPVVQSPVVSPRAAPPRPAAPATAAPDLGDAANTAAAEFTVRRVLDVPEPMRIGDYRWDDSGVAPGPVVVTVDLAAGMLSIFRGGYEIGTAAIVYGGDEKPTPLGVFPITQKDAHHISNLYHAEMPYMQRLTNDGVTIHGTEGIQSGWATHGCVGVPVAFARKLFGATRLGDPVIVTRGKRLAMGQAIVEGREGRYLISPS